MTQIIQNINPALIEEFLIAGTKFFKAAFIVLIIAVVFYAFVLFIKFLAELTKR